MRVLGLVGSPRKEGNTDILVRHVLKGVETYGVEIEVIYLSDLDFKACTGCEGCRESFRCVKKDDMQGNDSVLNSNNYIEGLSNDSWIARYIRRYGLETSFRGLFTDSSGHCWMLPQQVHLLWHIPGQGLPHQDPRAARKRCGNRLSPCKEHQAHIPC